MTATPESLHLLAHHAQARARTADDWWDNALDTALAAVGATRHPPGFREQGEGALERLRRWHRDGEFRRVSADAAALALAARAAVDLARRDHNLQSAAAEAVEDLASRSGPAAPTLHLTLSAWALDSVIPDRSDAPWPQIRAHFAARQPSSSSLDLPLQSLASALATEPFDAPSLVRSLLPQIPISPGLEDTPVLMWVTTVAIERCSPAMSADDAGLRALADRRTELALRLAQEVDAEAFQHPEVVDFDPEADLDLGPTLYLSPMEALLLDMSLASPEPDHTWLRFDEGEALFGQRGAQAERQLAYRSAAFLTVAGFLAGGLLALGLTDIGVSPIVAIPAAIALASGGWLWATVLVYRNNPTRLLEALGLFFAAVALAAGFDTLNQALDPPLIPDIGGYIAGLVGAALFVVLFFALARSDGRGRPR